MAQVVAETTPPERALDHRRGGRSTRLERWLLLLVVALVWEGVARSGLFSHIIFPTIPAIVSGMWDSALNANLLRHFRVTVLEIAAAFVLASVVGVSLGMAMGRIGIVGRTLSPFLSLAFSVPLIVLAPFFTIVFGLGPYSKIAFAAVYAFFPIAMNTYARARTLEPSLLHLSASLGMSRTQTLRHIILPSCFPAIAAGLENGMALTVIGVLAMEMLSSYAGVGYLLQRASTSIRTGEVYGLVLLTLVMGGILNRLIHRLRLRVRRERGLG